MTVPWWNSPLWRWRLTAANEPTESVVAMCAEERRTQELELRAVGGARAAGARHPGPGRGSEGGRGRCAGLSERPPGTCAARRGAAALRTAAVALGAVARHRRPQRRPTGGVRRPPRPAADRPGQRGVGEPDHHAVPGVERVAIEGKSQSAAYACACAPLIVVTHGTFRCADCGWNYGGVCRGVWTPHRREMRAAVRNGPFLVDSSSTCEFYLWNKFDRYMGKSQPNARCQQLPEAGTQCTL